jgi:hypothetical protein
MYPWLGRHPRAKNMRRARWSCGSRRLFRSSPRAGRGSGEFQRTNRHGHSYKHILIWQGVLSRRTQVADGSSGVGETRSGSAFVLRKRVGRIDSVFIKQINPLTESRRYLDCVGLVRVAWQRDSCKMKGPGEAPCSVAAFSRRPGKKSGGARTVVRAGLPRRWDRVKPGPDRK